MDKNMQEQLWKDPDWTCPNCQFVNFAIRRKCRNCGLLRQVAEAKAKLEGQ